jgi:hypothetical protein
MKIDFEHHQGAHCESGVTSSLLWQSSKGKITEPLAFGIGAGLFFVYVPFIKINNGPGVAFRNMPGFIFARTCKSLGIPVIRKKFSSPEAAAKFLDQRLAEGTPVGCQVGVYYLPYFPKEYRFHFNAHNLIVYEKEGDNYTVSDPIMERPSILSTAELERVRFARGPLAPKGHIYYPAKTIEITGEVIKKAIKSGIRKNVFNMLSIPGPFGGVRGIRFMGKNIKRWRDKLGLETAGAYLAQLVRMQEEIGTGGGGFRYIYAAFLQQADSYLPGNQLDEISTIFTQAGDTWRESAVHAAGIYKGRLGSQADFDMMGDYLAQISEIEKGAFQKLKDLKWQP